MAIQHARPSTPTHWLLGSLSGLVVLAFGRVLLTEYALIGHLWSAADTYTSCLKSARGGPQADGELEAALPECLTFALGIQILAAAAALALGRGACVKRWVPWIAAHGILAGVLGLGADWSSLVGMRSGLLALGGLHKIDLIADIHDDYYFPFAFWSGGSFTLTLLLFWQLRWRWPAFGLLSMCCVPLWWHGADTLGEIQVSFPEGYAASGRTCGDVADHLPQGPGDSGFQEALSLTVGSGEYWVDGSRVSRVDLAAHLEARFATTRLRRPELSGPPHLLLFASRSRDFADIRFALQELGKQAVVSVSVAFGEYVHRESPMFGPYCFQRLSRVELWLYCHAGMQRLDLTAIQPATHGAFAQKLRAASQTSRVCLDL